MKQFQDVTLEEAYRYVQQHGFGRWMTKGNFMDIENLVIGENVETWVFLGEAIFIFGLSVEVENNKVMASPTDFIDIWPTVKTKYCRLFKEQVKGDLCLIP